MQRRAYMLNRRVYYGDISNLMTFQRVPHRSWSYCTYREAIIFLTPMLLGEKHQVESQRGVLE